MQAYLDNSATTRPFEEVATHIAEVMIDYYGNPSSMHMKGVEAERQLVEATKIISDSLKCKPSEILYTSGGTESDNMALVGVARARHRYGKHIITTRIEHPAILETCASLEKEGFEISYLNVDEFGIVDLKELEGLIRKDTILVSVMHTNNEIGAVEPIEEIGNLIKRVNPDCLFHVDAVQGYGKYQIIPKRMKIDMLSVSAHKIHGPRGIGFLYIKEKTKINPIIWGGGQQKGMRSGTENVPGICGMAKAVELIYKDLKSDTDKLYALKTRFIKALVEIDGVSVNGIKEIDNLEISVRETAPHIVSASFEGVRSEVLLHALEDKGIYVSAGSACASNRPHVSATLTSIGLDKNLLDSTIRFSFSVYTTEEEIDYTIEVLNELLPVLKKYTRG